MLSRGGLKSAEMCLQILRAEDENGFREIKNRVLRDWDWKKIVEHFDLKHKRRSTGTIILQCLVHAEKTPSLVLSEKSGRFMCYGCLWNGDLFEFLFYFLEAVSIDDFLFKINSLGNL